MKQKTKAGWFSVLLILFLISVSQVKGQSLDLVPKVKPITPDAAAMFKVLERPLGTYTGTIPVNIPFFGINSGPLAANISLNYNSTGGVRVEEIASSVGLGFSLADGAGRITQMVNDLPDDSPNGYLNYGMKPSTFDPYDMYDIEDNQTSWSYDLEPDMYIYNFAGRSGKFFIKENGTVAIVENAGIKVEYVMGGYPYYGITKWIITDENGNKHYFGNDKNNTVTYKITNEYSYASLVGGASSGGVASSSWYLAESRDMNEENLLKYTYVSTNAAFITVSGASFRFYTPNSYNCSNFNLDDDISAVSTSAGEYVVTRIGGNAGYMLFNSTANRLDGAGLRKINNIELYDTNNNLKKKVKFNYEYFNPLSSDVNERRLKLKNVAEFGSSGTDSLTHKFEYEELQNLPSRMSHRTDYWGFFNGSYNSAPYPSLVFSTGGGGMIRYGLGDRNANGGYAEANILKKITYPTGGHREFVYEGNRALMGFNPGNYHPDPEFINPQSMYESSFTFDYSPMPCMVKTFEVNSTDGGAIFSYMLNGGMYGNFEIKIFKTSVANDLYGGFEYTNFYNNQYSHGDLVNGYYRIELYQEPGNYIYDFSANWEECTLTTALVNTPNGWYNRDNRSAGGVRIKELKDYDPVTAKTNSTKYFYKLYSTDSTLTSGLLVTPLSMITLQHPWDVGCNFYTVSSSSSYPLATEGGSYVVYPEVRTVESGNGLTDRLYSYFSDSPPANFPYGPVESASAMRNQLLAEKVYDQSGSLLRKTTNTYNYSGGLNQMGIRTKGYYSTWPGIYYEYNPSSLLPAYAVHTNYYVSSGSPIIATKQDSTFSGGNKLGINTEYSYHFYNYYAALKQTKVTVNGGQTKSTTYRYSFNSTGDFAFGLTSPEQTMKSTLQTNNYLQPLEVLDSIKPSVGAGTLLGGAKLSFDYFNSTKIHLAKVKEYTSPSVYSETILSAYDSYGNLTEKYMAGGTKEVYLWGYWGAYLVAKITGSDYATAYSWITPSTLNNPASDAALQSHLDTIRTNLASTPAQVETYAYSPLTGMTSGVDAKGSFTFYEYDNFQRLKVLKDHNGYIVKTYQYNYKP